MADRFQHSGWLETYFHAKYPDDNLVFRNLAAPGDEVARRERSEGFGSQDDWLSKVKADVVFAFFGWDESFQGPAGLEKFRKDLATFLQETKKKNYSGKDPARVVLFSPIAEERNIDSNFPAPSNNGNLRLYSEAMVDVARENNVPFVDLFGPSTELFTEAAGKGQSLTINGIHLNETGDKLIAQAIMRAVNGSDFSANALVETGSLEKLRAAVIEKNAQWEARYRTIDGNNIYGTRSILAYAPGKQMIYERDPKAPYISNYKVMQEEMAQRDALTANRDKRIWALANGKDIAVDDSNLPPVTAVPTDLPGTNADGSYTYLDATAAIEKMTVHSRMKVNLFASEEQFPELVNPVQMAWDTKGRLWVAVWKNYPERTPTSKVGDSLLILEDTKGTGKADKVTHFMDDLNAPTGFQFYKDGVLLMEAPDLWWVQNVSDHAGPVERVLMGLSSADSHHTANSLCLDPGGATYLSDGIFHRTAVETADGPLHNTDGGLYRFEPRTGKFETYIAYNFMNPHGRVFDYWGNDFVTDATMNYTYFGEAMSAHLDYPAKHREMKQVWDRPSRPCAGTGLLDSEHFPPDLQGDFMDCNVIGFQGIYMVKLSQDGAGIQGKIQEPLVSSTDPNFRPVAVNIGPDGAIYFSDWHKPLIGHMQHHLRDPNRDQDHGRIYRITYEGRPLLTQPRIDSEPIPALLDLLKARANRTRELAKIELGKRDTGEVISALDKWTADLKQDEPDYDHDLLEALWVHQWHNVVDSALLRRVLQSPRPEARAAAGRVLCYWRDRVPDSLALFKSLADDGDVRVRLQAVRAASFYTNLEAVDVALAVSKHPMDYYVNYTLGETLTQLRPLWLSALQARHDFGPGTKHLLGMLDIADLQKLPKTDAVLEAVVERNAATETDRLNALNQLTKNGGGTHVAKLFEIYGSKIETDNTAAAEFARLLVWQHRDELQPQRDRLYKLAQTSHSPELRRAAWVTTALADNTFENVWADASKSGQSFVDLIEGIPMLNDAAFRARAYGRVEPLVDPKIQESDEIRRAAVRAIAGMNYEPQNVFALLTGLIQKGQCVPEAAEGLRIIPRDKWPADQAAAAARGLAAWAKGVPKDDRTSQDYVSTVQLASDLGGFLPADQVADFQNELLSFRVPVFAIRTVREQMRYDTPRLVVETNQAIEIRLHNDDFMQHNLVIVKPGAREKVGKATEHMKPDQLDKQGRAFIADKKDIVAATKLLEPGQDAVLKFTTADAPGDYEYLCTFPGHYLIMRGELVVTDNVGKYLKEHPLVANLQPPASQKANEFQ